ncbi:MAG: hypothetical protein RMX68_012355 [Aulosira sp. ZfuVER01]|nr:hypothetical protein [Aulosira sp. ZfuVER01]MDZ7999271.1 hypothetical protein [Aulosira sp. DedVER01a]MDZ8051948.1 hypothetical protein [Aulosira sp. ZfuCHP01]
MLLDAIAISLDTVAMSVDVIALSLDTLALLVMRSLCHSIESQSESI